MNGIRVSLVVAVAFVLLAAGIGFFAGRLESGSTAPSQVSGAAAPPGMSATKAAPLYYRNPMGLPDTSPVPKKDAMGMDYIPVYASQAGTDANVVQVDPARVQMLGVRTAQVESRPPLAHTVRATGTIQFDERRLAVVTTKVAGWVERLDVSATGEFVRAGQPMLELYSPDVVAAEQEYLVVAGMNAGAHGNMMHGDPVMLVDAAVKRLRALDVPAGEIERLRRTGAVSHSIAVLAPANGIVTEKDAVLGLHIDPGASLYKTADLSTVWLIAEVQEQDLGSVQAGATARATMVAFPGRSFKGVVDFVYPMLSPETRTAKVRIVVPNPDGDLRADLYATVDIETKPASSAAIVAVPDSAVIDNGTQQVVLIARGEGRFEPRVVRIGTRGDGYVEVLDGVKPGEQVVVSANFLIDAESNLRAALQSFTSGPKSGVANPSNGDTP